ncbi:MAG: DUF6675 family protein [Spirochaetota bacterium]
MSTTARGSRRYFRARGDCPRFRVLAIASLILATAFAGAAPALASPQGPIEVETREYLTFLAPSDQAALLAAGSLGDSGGSLAELRLWRASPLAGELLARVGDRPATLAAERWFILPPVRASTKEERDQRIFRALTSFSTMKGLRTRSVLFAGTEDFITESYRVGDVDRSQRLPDPRYSKFPDSATYTLYGREALVGDVYYELHCISHGTWFELDLTNLSAMKTLFLTLVQPRELLTVFHVVPTQDGLLLYALALAKTPMLPGIVGIERASLENRMMALASWFQGNMEKQ